MRKMTTVILSSAPCMLWTKVLNRSGWRIKDFKVNESTPKFFTASNVPCVLGPKVEAELERIEQSGALSEVEYSEWAAPIVPVVKTDGNVRICGDFRVPVNHVPSSQDRGYLHNVGCGQHFTKI